MTMTPTQSSESGESLSQTSPQNPPSTTHEDQIKFLESMVSQYEALIKDMTTELSECQNSLKTTAANENLIIFQSREYETEKEILDMKQELSRKDVIIENLLQQLDAVSKSKHTARTLWQSTMEQVEYLESSETSPANKSSFSQLPSNFLSKWKMLQTYATMLEKRVEKSTNEVNFYRNKILEIRLEQETLTRRKAWESSNQLEQAKSSYAKEIEHLRSKLGNLRQEFQESFEKRLEAEKTSWEYEEAQKLRLVRVKVEEVLKENKILESKASEDAYLAQNLATELLHLRGELALMIGNQAQAQNENENPDSDLHLQQSTIVSKPDTRSYSVQTEGEFVSSDNIDLVKLAHSQMVVEYESSLSKIKLAEDESIKRCSRLHDRIQELESGNLTMHTQLADLQEVHESLRKRFHRLQKENQSHAEKDTQKNILEGKTKLMQKFENEGVEFEFIPFKPTFAKDVDFDKGDSTIENCRREIAVLRLQQQLKQMKADREMLLSVIDQQQNISVKWKLEFKQLAKKMFMLKDDQ